MTNQEINSMVAERVMGLTLSQNSITHYQTVRGWGKIAEYSTDIVATWQMEEKIFEIGLQNTYVRMLSSEIAPDTTIFLSTIELDTWNGDAEKYLFALVHATPKQRCLAALKAVGMTVEQDS